MFGLNPLETQETAAQALIDNRVFDPSVVEPSFFEGSLTAIPRGVLQGVVAQPTMLLTDAVTPTLSSAGAKVDSIFGTDIEGYFLREQQKARNLVRNLTPDPRTNGTASQIIYGAATVLPQAAIGTLAAGPAGGAALAGTLQGYSETVRLQQEGVDENTAIAAGAVQGVSMGLGVLAPAAIGTGVVQKVLSGAGLNVALGIPSRYATSEILKSNGYDEMAQQFAPLDATSIAADAILGGAFGGVDVLLSGRKDAAIAVKNNRHAEVEVSPGLPVNTAARMAHTKALDAKMEELITGETKDISQFFNFKNNDDAGLNIRQTLSEPQEKKDFQVGSDGNGGFVVILQGEDKGGLLTGKDGYIKTDIVSGKTTSFDSYEEAVDNAKAAILHFRKTRLRDAAEKMADNGDITIDKFKQLLDMIYGNHDEGTEFVPSPEHTDAFNTMRSVLDEQGYGDTIREIEKLNERVRSMGLDVADAADARYSRMTAYHGSPHKFDKFTLDNMGGGEGAQAFGWGLYFAGKKEVAEYYRSALSKGDPNDPVYNAYDIVTKYYRGDADRALSSMPTSAEINAMGERADFMRQTIAAIRSGEWKNAKVSGQLYEVSIPEESVMLDRDQPLNKQPEKVKEALRSAGFDVDRTALKSFDDALFDILAKGEDAKLPEQPDNPTGEVIYERLKKQAARGQGEVGKLRYERGIAPDQAASEYLNSLGIKGMKYLDGVSRSGGEGTYNYVVFDDSAIDVMNTFYSRMNSDAIGATVGEIDNAVRASFGDATDALMKAGKVKVVQSVKDLPGEHPADVRGMTDAKGNVYIVADNVSLKDVRGLVLHEVGVHAGMERMLGKSLFNKVLTDLEQLEIDGNARVAEARRMIPQDTKPDHVREELLAYLVQNAPELPLVQRILSQIKNWLYKISDGKIVNLTDRDLTQMAVAALKNYAKDGGGARDGNIKSENNNGSGSTEAMDNVVSELGGKFLKRNYDDIYGTGDRAEISVGDSVLRLSLREDDNGIYIVNIAAKQADGSTNLVGSGLGTKAVNVLKSYSDQTGKPLAVVGATDTAVTYWNKLGWLNREPVSLFMGDGFVKNENDFVYRPTKKAFVNQPNDARDGDAMYAGDKTNTPAFKEWFGDSKVVDADGKPLVVYHGTAYDVESFDPKRLGINTDAKSAKLGFFFTDNPTIASQYAELAGEGNDLWREVERLERGGRFDEAASLTERLEAGDTGLAENVMPVYVSIKNPMVIDFQGRKYDASRDNLSAEISKAKANGHDGIIFKNLDDSVYRNGAAAADHFVAFRPEQIKSIFNRGTFDPNDARILYGRGDDAMYAKKTDVKEGYIRIYRGLEKRFDPNYNLTSTDAPNGYSTWTDSPELARQYAGEKGYVYYVDLPKADLGKDVFDQDGERTLFFDNEKKAGLNNVSGKEYLLYTQHEKYDANQINELSSDPSVSYSRNEEKQSKAPVTLEDQVLADNPDIAVVDENGQPMRAEMAIEQADETVKTAEKDGKLFEVAANCFLRG